MRLAVLLLVAMPVVWTGALGNGDKLKLNRGSDGRLVLSAGTGKSTPKLRVLSAEAEKAHPERAKRIKGYPLPEELLTFLESYENAADLSVHQQSPAVRKTGCPRTYLLGRPH